MKKSWDNFLAEADAGEWLKFPRKMKFYIKWILPVGGSMRWHQKVEALN